MLRPALSTSPPASISAVELETGGMTAGCTGIGTRRGQLHDRDPKPNAVKFLQLGQMLASSTRLLRPSACAGHKIFRLTTCTLFLLSYIRGVGVELITDMSA